MILYNVTCNVTQEVENQWLEWVDLQLNNISKSEKIIGIYILKLNTNISTEEVVYAIQYQIRDQNTLENFLNNEDKTLKDRINMDFGDAVIHFSSQLEIINKYP